MGNQPPELPASLPKPPPRPRKRRWLLKVFLAILVVLGILHLPIGSGPLRVSPETTVLTGPVNADGTVDYVAAFNAEQSAGVTPENNAVVLLWKAAGVDANGNAPDDRVLEPMGLKRDELGGDKAFVSWAEWGKLSRTPSKAPASGEDPSVPDEQPWPSFDDVFADLRAGRVNPLVDAWLDRNSAAFDLIAEASRRPRCYVPLVSNSSPATMADSLGGSIFARQVVEAIRTIELRAELRISRGDSEGAWQDAMTLRRLGRFVSRNQGLTAQMIGAGMDAIASDMGRRLATRFPMSPSMAKQIAAELNALGPACSLEEGARYDRMMVLDLVASAYRGKPAKNAEAVRQVDALLRHPRLTIDVNVALQRINWWHDRMDQAVRLRSFQQRVAVLNALSRDAAARPNGWQKAGMFALRMGGWACRGAYTTPFVDYYMMTLSMPTLGSVAECEVGVEMRRRIEILAVALAGYHAEHGRWPEKLAELVPEYTDRITGDIFSDQHLNYTLRADGFLLYSVGPNGRDDHGRGDVKGADDIAASIPAAPFTQGS